MAITRAQQYRQMLKDGNVAVQGGVKNYLGKQKTVSNVPVKWQSNPDAPSTELAYITKAEKDLLLKKDIHGSLKDGPNTGPEGIMSLDSQGDKVKDRSGGRKATTPSTASQDTFRQSSLHTYGDSGDPARVASQKRASGPTYSVAKTKDDQPFVGGAGSGGSDDPDDQPIKDLQEFYDKPANYPKYVPSYVKFLANLNRRPNRKYFVEKVLRAGKIPGLDYQDIYDEDFDIETAYQNYMSNRMAGKTDAMGNPVAGFQYNDSGNLVGDFIDDRGPDPIPFIPKPIEDDTEEDTTTPVRNLGGLTSRIGGSLFDFDNMADGGIANLDREAFLLGGLAKGLKKAVRGVKKLVKSPVGKMALGAAIFSGGFGLGGLQRGLFGITAKGQALRGFPELAAKKGLFGKLGLTGGYGSLMPTALGGITLASLAAGAMTPKQDDNKFDLAKYYASGQTGDVEPYARIAGSKFDFYGAKTQPVADGGRIVLSRRWRYRTSQLKRLCHY